MEKLPLIFDIRPFSLDDGPGIRTTVFLKGCPLSCVWCHNPEGISRSAQMAFSRERCVGCDQCRAVCPEGAVRRGRIDRVRCLRCGACARACPGNALRLIGRYYPPGELVEALMADEIFYRTSGGGVTFSGGEPTLYPEYVGEIAGALRKNGVHVAIETAGTFDFDEFAGKLLPFVDLIYFDIKIIDNNKYRQCAGGDNRIPLENFRRLREYPGVTVVPSVPLVHGLTATGGNLAAIARFLRDTNGVAPVFRPYHPGAEAKRRLLGDAVIPRTAAPDAPLSAREERSAQRFFTRAVSPEPG